MNGIGAIGGGMAMSGAACMGGAATLNFGGLNGAVGQSGMQGLSTVKMQQLVELVSGFTSAEILMALMLAAAASKKKDDEGGCSALAMLAGMALAQQLGQGIGQLGSIDLGLNASTTGGACNLLA